MTRHCSSSDNFCFSLLITRLLLSSQNCVRKRTIYSESMRASILFWFNWRKVSVHLEMPAAVMENFDRGSPFSQSDSQSPLDWVGSEFIHFNVFLLCINIMMLLQAIKYFIIIVIIIFFSYFKCIMFIIVCLCIYIFFFILISNYKHKQIFVILYINKSIFILYIVIHVCYLMNIFRAHSQMTTGTIAKRKTEIRLARVAKNIQKRQTYCMRSEASWDLWHTLSLSLFEWVCFALSIFMLPLQILTFVVYVSFHSHNSHKNIDTFCSLLLLSDT